MSARSLVAFGSLILTLTLAGCTIEPAERTPVENDPNAIDPTPTVVAKSDSTPPTTPDPETTPEPEPTPEPEANPTSSPEPEPTPTPEPAFAGEDWVERGRLTVLLAGTDPGFYHDGSRTDAMTVASIDLETGHVALFGIPRSFGDIRLPDYLANALGYSTYSGQINWLYRIGENNPELFPDAVDPGMYILRGAVSQMLGIPIDYYAMVDMGGFIRLVDAIGGVEVNVRQPIHVRILLPEEGAGWREFNIQPGEQTLDGGHALAYARSRSGSSDYDRMERQRCIVASAVEQYDVATMLQTFPEVVDAIQENVVTNVPLEQLPDMIMLRDEISSDRIIPIGFNPPTFAAGQSSDGHVLPDYDAIRNAIQHVFAEPAHYLEGGGTEVLDDRHC